MSIFHKREDAIEFGLVHDEEMRFRCLARRNKLLGIWAATQLALSEEDSKQYAANLITLDFSESGDKIIETIANDMVVKGISIAKSAIAQKVSDLMVVAISDIKKGS